jgi:hypothetical protein
MAHIVAYIMTKLIALYVANIVNYIIHNQITAIYMAGI